MLSNRPYLLRAFHQWIVDSNCTPILVLDATNPRCKIPEDYIEGGEIVFNISPVAVRDLEITNEMIQFKASFSGVIHIITAPIKAILAIYAEENGEGLFLDAEDTDGDIEGDVFEDMNASDSIVKLKSIDGSSDPAFNAIVSGEPSTRSKPFLKLVE